MKKERIEKRLKELKEESKRCFTRPRSSLLKYSIETLEKELAMLN